MAAEDITSTAVLVKETFAAAVQTKFVTDQLLRLFPRRVQMGDTGVRWTVHRTGNSSFTTMTEGDAAPAAGQQGYVEALVPWTYFHGTVSVSRMAADRVRGGSTLGSQSLQDESIAQGIRDMLDVVNSTYVGTTAAGTGILDMVDSTTTYAGLNRTTYSDWGAYEDNVSGALAIGDLQDMAEAIRDADRGGRMTSLFSRTNQISNYYNLAGATNTIANIARVVMTPNDAFDLSPSRERANFEGTPWYEMFDIANTVILGLDTSPGNWEFVEIRGVTVDPLGRTRDYDDMYVTYGCALVCKNPRKQGKLIGVTA